MTFQELGVNNLLYRTTQTTDILDVNGNIVSAANSSLISGGSNSSGVSSTDIVSGEMTGNLFITKGFIRSKNYVTGVSGWTINDDGSVEFGSGYFRGDITGATGTFSGTITGGALNIPDTTTASSFHTDSSGNAWWGTNVATGYATAPAKILATGAATFSSITITGGSVATSTLLGLVGLSNTNISAQGWTNTCVFSATNYRVVAWASGVITTAAGVAYNITGANTGNMAATTYIYLDIAVSTTLLQITTTAATAIGSGKILIATAVNNSDTTSKAQYQVFGGIGGVRLFVDNISANSASTNEFVSNSAQLANLVVTDAKINTLAVSKLTAGTISSKTITLAVSEGTGDVYIAAGKTDFTNTDAGFILGVDDSDSNLAKLYIGNSLNYLNWNGANLTILGDTKNLKAFTCGENITAGDVVCLKPTYTDYPCTYSTYVDELYPTTNYGSNTTLWIGDHHQFTNVYALFSYINFDLSTIPASEYILKAELYLTSDNTYFNDTCQALIGRVTSAWDESTVVYNTKPTHTEDITTYETLATFDFTDAAQTKSRDITQFIRSIKAGDVSLANGLIIGSTFDGTTIAIGGNTRLYLCSNNNATAAYRPYIRIWSVNTSDGKIYKASTSDYTTRRSVIGIAKETKTTAQSCLVQTGGSITDLSFSSNTGGRFYLGATAGQYLTSLNNTENVICLGQILTNSEAQINIQDQDILIESRIPSTIATGATKKYYVPNGTRYAVIYYKSVYSSRTMYRTIIAYRGSLGQSTITDGEIGTSTAEEKLVVTWGANYFQLAYTTINFDTPVTILGISLYT